MQSTQPSPLRCRVGSAVRPSRAARALLTCYGPQVCSAVLCAFFARRRPRRKHNEAARRLPDQSTTLWMEPSAIGKPCPRSTQRSEAITVGHLEQDDHRRLYNSLCPLQQNREIARGQCPGAATASSGGRSREPYCAKVLQLSISPLCNPVVSHFCRIAEEPWVKLSGTA